MKTCTRFHFEDVERGDRLVLTPLDGPEISIEVSEKRSTQTFGQVLMATDGEDYYLQDFESVREDR